MHIGLQAFQDFIRNRMTSQGLLSRQANPMDSIMVDLRQWFWSRVSDLKTVVQAFQPEAQDWARIVSTLDACFVLLGQNNLLKRIVMRMADDQVKSFADIERCVWQEFSTGLGLLYGWSDAFRGLRLYVMAKGCKPFWGKEPKKRPFLRWLSRLRLAQFLAYLFALTSVVVWGLTLASIMHWVVLPLSTTTMLPHLSFALGCVLLTMIIFSTYEQQFADAKQTSAWATLVMLVVLAVAITASCVVPFGLSLMCVLTHALAVMGCVGMAITLNHTLVIENPCHQCAQLRSNSVVRELLGKRWTMAPSHVWVAHWPSLKCAYGKIGKELSFNRLCIEA